MTQTKRFHNYTISSLGTRRKSAHTISRNGRKLWRSKKSSKVPSAFRFAVQNWRQIWLMLIWCEDRRSPKRSRSSRCWLCFTYRYCGISSFHCTRDGGWKRLRPGFLSCCSRCTCCRWWIGRFTRCMCEAQVMTRKQTRRILCHCASSWYRWDSRWCSALFIHKLSPHRWQALRGRASVQGKSWAWIAWEATKSDERRRRWGKIKQFSWSINFWSLLLFRQRPINSSVDLKLSIGYDSDDEQSMKHHRNIKPNLKVNVDLSEPAGCSSNTPPPDSLIRRRNVNWESPVKSAIHQPSSSVDVNPKRRRNRSENVMGDDGFESLTGKSSSGEENLRNLPSLQSDSDTDTLRNSERSTPVKLCKKKKTKESSDTDEENDDIESLTPASSNHQFETTDGEYIGVTSNSESECSVDHSGDDDAVSPTTILNPNDSSEKVSCTIWTKHEAKKTEMSVLDISVAIIQRVESIPETCDYVYIGLVLSLILSLTPTYCRLCDVAMDSNSTGIPHIIFDLPRVMMEDSSSVSFTSFMHLAFGRNSWEKTLLIIATGQRLVLAFLFFFLLAVAERTFKQRCDISWL